MSRIEETLAPFRARSFALIIGLDRFEHEGSRLRPLRCPVKDVKAVGAMLVSQGGFAQENVFALCNEEATLRGISRALKTIRDRIRRLRHEGPLACTRLVVFYSGHGVVGPGSNGSDTTYLATWETEHDPAQLPVTALDVALLDRMISTAAPDQDLRFYDCCHAHGAKGDAGGAMATLMAAMTRARGRGIVYACDRDELAWEMCDGSGSIFALALVEAIRYGAPDHGGVVDLHGIAHYVQRRVPELSLREHGEKQTPCLELQHIDGPMPLAFRLDAFERRLRLVAELTPRLVEAASAGRLGMDRHDVEELLGRWFDPGTLRQALQVDGLLDTASADAGERLYDWLTPESVRRRLVPAAMAPAAASPAPTGELTFEGYAHLCVKQRVGARTVFFAVAADGVPCVIKTLAGGNSDERGRFDQEGRLLERVKSTHLPRFFERFRDPSNGCSVIVMERIDGENLDEVMSRGQSRGFSIRAVLDILRQLAEALEDLQAQNVVHRDLKPANIVVRPLGDERWIVRLVDLGIAKDLDETQGTHLLAALGTLLWMAPEQTNGGTSTPATDVYALALLAYWLLTGESYWHPEFLAANGAPHAIHEAVRRGIVEPASERARLRRGVDLPPAFDTVFARAMAHRPEDRFEGASDFFAELVVALSGPSDAGSEDRPSVETTPPPAPEPIAPLSLDLAMPLQIVHRRSAVPLLAALFMVSGVLLLLSVMISAPAAVTPDAHVLSPPAPSASARALAPPVVSTSASAPAPSASASATATPRRVPAPRPVESGLVPRPVDIPPPTSPVPRAVPTAAAERRVLDCMARNETKERLSSGKLQFVLLVGGAGVSFDKSLTNLSPKTRACAGID